MYLRQLILLIGLAIAAPLYSQANYVNITVDDSGSDVRTGSSIIYSPHGGWNTGASCSLGCIVHPDPSRLYSGTWHDSTSRVHFGFNGIPQADFKFVGVAVYVIAVLKGGSTSDMTFYINGTVAGRFTKTPHSLGNGDYQYNTAVFSSKLPQGTHTLRIRNGHVGGPDSLMILDSVIYTHDYYAD